MIKNFIKKIINFIVRNNGDEKIQSIYDLILYESFHQKTKKHLNPINQKAVLNGFSQNEEDSITLEIIKRIGLKKGYFVEFGVGNGLENNTIILLASNWNGAWFGAENLAFNILKSKKLLFRKSWITKENILDLYYSTKTDADVISLDLDGNDIYLIEKLLSNNIFPKLYIVEYNSKFPPNIDFKIDYDPSHKWQSDDYFGASLKSFNDLFLKYDYRLVCCNITGSNAFFVKNEFTNKFNDVPNEINDIYNEPFYFLRNMKMHPTSLKTITKLIE